MRSGASVRIFVVVTLLSLFGSPPAASAAPSESEKLISRGVELRRQKKDEEALELFRRAYDLDRSPRALAQIALAEQALGRWVDAEAHLVSALDDKSDPWINGNRAQLDRALETIRGRLGSVEIVSTTKGAQVRLNGESVGSLPLRQPIRVVAGAVVIEVTADGYWPVTRAIQVPPGGFARESISLVALARPPEPPHAGPSAPAIDPNLPGGPRETASSAPTPPVAAPNAAAPSAAAPPPATRDGSAAPTPRDGSAAPTPRDGSATPTPGDGSATPTPGDASATPTPGDGSATPPPSVRAEAAPTEDEGGSTLSLLAWIAGAGAVAGLGGGVVGVVIRENRVAKYNDDERCTPIGGGTREQTCGADRRAAQSAGTLALIGLIAGTALAGTSAALFVLAPSDDDPSPTASVSLGGRPGDLTLTFTGRF